MKPFNSFRRKFLSALGLASGAAIIGKAQAHHTITHFEDDSKHHVVYQLNKADNQYISSILFSAGELLRKYGDDVEIVIVCIGPGLHLLGKEPGRPIDKIHQERAASLASYGVAFHACGNTMTTLHWGPDALLPFATIVQIGAEDLMLLQEKGFAYISW